MSPSLACKEFLQNLRKVCDDELMFRKQKADPSLCSRRRDFNFLYIQFCKDKFGDRNGANMYEKMELKINEYLNKYKDTRVNYQIFDGVSEQSLIITIVTPLMCRVHEMARISAILLRLTNECLNLQPRTQSHATFSMILMAQQR